MTLPLGMSGTFEYTVNAVSSEFSQTIDATVVIESAAAVAPVLQGPADGDQEISTLPTLTWGAAVGASGYSLELSTTPDFTDPF